MKDIDADTRTELEAAAFRRLLAHLSEHPEVQNIALMNMAGFCRNCLANWLMDAARDRGLDVGKDASRTHVYGMPYDEWRARFQQEASPDQKAAFDARAPGHG